MTNTKTPRVTKDSIRNYCHEQMDADTHNFDIRNGYSQVRGQDAETRKAYGTWAFYRESLQHLAWGEIYDVKTNRFSKAAVVQYLSDRERSHLAVSHHTDYLHIADGGLAAIAKLRKDFGL